MTNLGVVIVTYNAADVIGACLDSLLASHQDMRVAVIDNASTDATIGVLSSWSEKVYIVRSATNGGFAAGVNIGIAHLLRNPEIDRIWILNPDTVIPPETPSAFAKAPVGFALMGGRILYADSPNNIQIDAGTVNFWTGVTGNLNLGKPRSSPLANADDADFISGASMVASRQFIERAGPMPEDYFLYYEEVDWAMKRGALPLKICPDATVYHSAGSAIGSPTLDTPASPFSTYYKHRARLMFLHKYNPMASPIGYLFGVAKAGQCLLRGQYPQARAIFRAIHGLAFLANEVSQPRHQAIKPGP